MQKTERARRAAIVDIINMTWHSCGSAVLVLIPRFGTWSGPNSRANSWPCDIENGAGQSLCVFALLRSNGKRSSVFCRQVCHGAGMLQNAVALRCRCAQLEAVPFRGRLLRTLQRLGLATIVQELNILGEKYFLLNILGKQYFPQYVVGENVVSPICLLFVAGQKKPRRIILIIEKV